MLLLDFSTAFDTVDHSKLFNILNWSIGVTGNALSWFKLFLIGRTYNVKMSECLSSEQELDCGVGMGRIF